MERIEMPETLESEYFWTAMDYVSRMLHIQGLIDTEPEPTFATYLHRTIPSLSGLVDNPVARGLLERLRSNQPVFIMTLLALQICVVHPVDIYLQWENKMFVLENTYMILIYILVGLACALLYFLKESIAESYASLKELTAGQCVHRKARAVLTKTDRLCRKLASYVNYLTVPGVVIGSTIYTLTTLLPTRTLINRGWYPFDIFASPIYEIYLFVWIFETSYVILQSNGGFSALSISFIFVKVHYNIQHDNLLNIRKNAIAKIKKTKLVASRRRKRTTPSSDRDVNSGVERFGVPVAEFEALRVHDATWRRSQVMVDIPGTVASESGSNITRLPESDSIPADDDSVTPQEIDREMQRQLKKFVKVHMELTRFVEEIGSYLNINLIAHFFLYNVAFGITTLMLGTVDPFTIKELIYLNILFEIVFIYFIYNVIATVITDANDALLDTLYACDWLEASPGFKRSMLIIMTRLNRPLVIQPSTLEPLSIRNFSNVTINAYKMLATLTSFVK